MAVERILCPLDFSECSRRSFEVAAALSGQFDARLTVLHVGEVPIYPDVIAATAPAQVPCPARAQWADRVARFIAPHADVCRPVDIVLDEGPVADVITQTATTLSADLIVMGTHGRRGFRRLALGSVTAHVVHAAECPVLVVPPAPAPAPSPQRFQRVICAATDIALEHQRAFAAADSHVRVISPGGTSSEVFRAIDQGRPDLIVWPCTSPYIDEVILGAPCPVLAVRAPVPVSW